MEKENVLKEILTATEVANLLSVSVRTVYRLKKKGVFKSYPLEGRNYYKRSEIREAIFKDAA